VTEDRVEDERRLALRNQIQGCGCKTGADCAAIQRVYCVVFTERVKERSAQPQSKPGGVDVSYVYNHHLYSIDRCRGQNRGWDRLRSECPRYRSMVVATVLDPILIQSPNLSTEHGHENAGVVKAEEVFPTVTSFQSRDLYCYAIHPPA
jgi:hypothetical protein